MTDVGGSKEAGDEISVKVLEFIRNELYLDLRYMGAALLAFKWKKDASLDTMATDGDVLYFSSEQLTRLFKSNPVFLNRLYLHSVLHCVYGHLWTSVGQNEKLWNIACDIIVEYTIDGIGKKSLKRPISWMRRRIYEKIDGSEGPVSAGMIYRRLLELDMERASEIFAEFYADSHKYWPKGECASGANQSAKNKWDKISRQSKFELDGRGNEGGNGARVFDEWAGAEASRRNYGDFLRKFAVLREELHCSDDEFDVNYYTYGLSLYKNVPLIEPLEAREAVKIKEFVVVVDTSYSTSGELVKNFLRETCAVLTQKNSFFDSCAARIIQCDDDVRMDIKINGPAELEEALKDFHICGGGGTDFRPAFRHVDRLIEEGEIKDLGGLIYFTDGKGIYPRKKPDYKTAFVFIDDFDDSALPAWAMRIRLSL